MDELRLVQDRSLMRASGLMNILGRNVSVFVKQTPRCQHDSLDDNNDICLGGSPANFHLRHDHVHKPIKPLKALSSSFAQMMSIQELSL